MAEEDLKADNDRLRGILARIAITAPHHERKNATWGEHGHYALAVVRRMADEALQRNT